MMKTRIVKYLFWSHWYWSTLLSHSYSCSIIIWFFWMTQSVCPSNTKGKIRPPHREEQRNVLAPVCKVTKGWFIHGVSYLLPRVDAVADPCTSGLGTALTQGAIIHLDREKIRKSDTTASLAVYGGAAAEHFKLHRCTLLTFIPSLEFWFVAFDGVWATWGGKKKKTSSTFSVHFPIISTSFFKKKKKEKQLFSNRKVRCQSANCLVCWSKRFPIFTKMTLKTSQTGAWTRRSQSNNAETSCCVFYIVMFFFH